MSGAERAPASWLLSHADALREAARRGPFLDLACGAGRNALAAARLGARVVGVDRSREQLGCLRAAAAAAALPVLAVQADLERGLALPVREGAFAAVLVFRYLHRPLAPAIAAALRPGGLLLYETFTIHQRKISEHPRNPAFLLDPGELPALFPALRRRAYEERLVDDPAPAAVARLLALRES